MIYQDLLEMIGNTPLLRIKSFEPHAGIEMYLKMEGCNPSGSHKDRPASSIIGEAIRRGDLHPGKKLIEASSGNMASAMAWIARQYGIDSVFVLANTTGVEKQAYLKIMGAELIMIDGSTIDCQEVAREMAANEPDLYYYPDQFRHPFGPRGHLKTGREIVDDLPDVDVLIASLGSGSSLMGIGTTLRNHNPEVEIYAIAAGDGTRIPGLRNLGEENWMPPYVEDPSFFNDIIKVNWEQGEQRVHELAKQEGILLGLQTGANIHAAVQIAKQKDKAKMVIKSGDMGWKNLDWLVRGQEKIK